MNPQPSSSSGLRSRPIFWIVSVLLIVGVIAAAYGAWYLFFRPSGPPPVDIGSLAVPSASAAASTGVGSSTGVSATTAPTSAGSTSAGSSSAASTGIEGTWTVDTSIGSLSDFTDSFVGYRVQEVLGSIGANTAVGRTPAVSGTMAISGTTVTAAEITADLTQLASDDQRRDGQLRRQGIETSQFPNATFKLTTPIELGSVPADGTAVKVTATGDLTLHGVTKSVQIAMAAKLSGGTIVVTGSLPIAFADYDITKPNSFAVLSIEDTGTMELQLFFTKS